MFPSFYGIMPCSVMHAVVENYLTLNSSKCKFMLVSRKKYSLELPKVKINDIDVEAVSSYKYLGVLLSSDSS